MSEMMSLFSKLKPVERQLSEGGYLFHQGDEVVNMHLILDGEIRLMRHQAEGGSVTMQRAEAGMVVAEASLSAETYHCDGVASANSRVLVVARSAFRELLRTSEAAASAWIHHLGRSLHQARFRSELLALRTVAERLDLWLAWNQCRLPAKGRWSSLAQELSVSREALYRELAKR